MQYARRLGIDENGLGPRLGPLVVTAIVARVTEDGERVAARRARGALSKRLGDSKALVAHGSIDLGEAWARAIASRTGHLVENPDELVHALSLDDREILRAPCPSHVMPQCWGGLDQETFGADSAMVDTARRDLDKLAAKGIDVQEARTLVVCTKRLNQALATGLSRFDIDLHAMERIVLRAHNDAAAPVYAVCGKVGGYTRYSSAFGPLAGRLHAVVAEKRARSEYDFPGIGRLAFVRDADATDLLVAMASLVGKWVREVLMGRIVRYYGDVRSESSLAGSDEPLDASGYHDPVTARFVDATALVRRKRRVPDTCFERTPASFNVAKASRRSSGQTRALATKERVDKGR